MISSEDAFFEMCQIRRFEQLLLEAVRTGKVAGTTHTCIGQEANAVGIINSLSESDAVWSNHRCHGHFIAYSKKPSLLLDEIIGRPSGVCGGRGGSQHLCYKNFFSSGVQGGFVPVAAGFAEAEKEKDRISVVFLGDGTLGQGVLYETLNIVVKRSIPVLFVIEDNGIAQTTPFDLVHSAYANSRFEGFGLPGHSLKTTNVMEIQATASEMINKIRADSVAHYLHLFTPRLEAHSKGDDTRPQTELKKLKQIDPIEVDLSISSRATLKQRAFDSMDGVFEGLTD